MEFTALPCTASIPYLTPTLHNILAPRLHGSGLRWLKGPGDSFEEREAIAEFEISWKRKDLKTVHPDLLDDVRRGVIWPPWPGIMRSIPATADVLFSFTPVVRSDWLADGTEKAIKSVEGYCTASRTYKMTSQTIWMVLELDHGGGNDAFINKELDLLDGRCDVRRD